ncbi:hypothetical protein KCU94_g114, partial [Aureobasidium melanogenum]
MNKKSSFAIQTMLVMGAACQDDSKEMGVVGTWPTLSMTSELSSAEKATCETCGTERESWGVISLGFFSALAASVSQYVFRTVLDDTSMTDSEVPAAISPLVDAMDKREAQAGGCLSAGQACERRTFVSPPISLKPIESWKVSGASSKALT